jgi:hypothetical protein
MGSLDVLQNGSYSEKHPGADASCDELARPNLRIEHFGMYPDSGRTIIDDRRGGA